MGKKQKRRSAPAAEQPAPVNESETFLNEADFLRDEIDEHLLERNEIRFDGDPDSEEDEDLATEEVLQLPDSEEEFDEEEEGSEDELKERDFEEIENEFRVKDKAWGKKKSVYYEEEDEEDLSSGAEEEMEAEEEREAMVLQKRLLDHMSEEHFNIDKYKADADAAQVKEVVIETNFDTMTRDEKLMFLMKRSPELPEMLEEFRDKLSEAQDPLYPLLQLGRQTGKFSDSAHSYIEAKYQLNLLYSLNVGFYLMMQSSENKGNLSEHPVIQKIVSLRKILNDCTKTDIALEREIENLLNTSEEQKELPQESSKKRKVPDDDKPEAEDLYEKQAKITAEKKQKRKKKKTGIEISSEDPTLMGDEEDKRGITYKIMKNKGLTPHRKKEQRNPRVKHRNKFDKALKKRRSQVPDMRDQGGAYSGEKSGIKSGLTKSTKLR